MIKQRDFQLVPRGPGATFQATFYGDRDRRREIKKRERVRE